MNTKRLRKKIFLPHGGVATIARELGMNRNTVRAALADFANKENIERVREKAHELYGVKI